MFFDPYLKGGEMPFTRRRVMSLFMRISKREGFLLPVGRCVDFCFDLLNCLYFLFPHSNRTINLAEWNVYCLQNDLEEKRSTLVSGLDSGSVRLVDLYLSRRQAVSFRFTLHEIFRWFWVKWFFPLPFVFPGNSTVSNEVFLYHSGLRELSDGVLERIRGCDALDGGAASGDSSLMLLGYGPRCVYAFEPSPGQREEMREVFRINGVPEGKIEVVPYGVGDGDDMFGLSDQCNRVFDALSITIDEYMDGHSVGVIKLDVEGAESKALRGAVGTIRRNKPILLISVYHTAVDFFEIKPFLQDLNLGYRFKIVATEFCNLGAGVHLMLVCY